MTSAGSESARTYRQADIKKLFALSYNACPLAGCEEKLADPAWPCVLAEICHIYGLRPGSARFDPAMSDEERNSFENLLLLCRNCHLKVDQLFVDEYPAERLLEIKRSHEQRRDATEWCSNTQLDQLVHRLAITLHIRLVGPGEPGPAQGPPDGGGLQKRGGKKIRVYELARELGMSNKEALDLCENLGINVKSHSTSLENHPADRVRRAAQELGLRRTLGFPPPPDGERPR